MNEVMVTIKKIGISVLKKIFKPLLIVSIVVIILVSMVYYIKKDDGTYDADDKSNTPFAVEQYTSSVSIDSQGNITTSMTAQELWNQMLENGARVDKYLNGPEELQKLINAQAVTDYPDTRQDTTKKIDWEKINKDVDSKAVQGIIKLKRAKSDGTTSMLKYTDPETFETYIENYNSSGSENDKQKALSYFTLEKSYVSSSSGTGEAIKAGTTIIIPEGLGSCHTYMGWQLITDSSSKQYKLREQAGMNFDEEGFGRINGRYVIACTTTFGQVGDYIDFYQEDGSVIQCIIGDIKSQNDAECTEWGHKYGQNIVEFIVDVNTWYDDYGGNHVNPGNSTCHPEWAPREVKAINGGSYFDNPNFGKQTITSNGNKKNNNNSIGNGLMKWPTDGTTITSPFGPRVLENGDNSTHKGIDIGVATGTNVYATEAGSVTIAGWSESAGNWVVIDHGNGYISKYMHNSQVKVAAGDKVTKGQLIALSGNTGYSFGAHLHFQIEYNGTAVDPMSFKYDNGMGNGTGGIGSDSNSSSTTTTFYAKVATWSELTEIVESNDSAVEQMSKTTYSMRSTKINYQDLVRGYKMPFDYLWALLVISEDKDFVLDLADLVYNSEFEITIHDNLSVNTNVAVETYTEKMKVITDNVVVNVLYTTNTGSSDVQEKQIEVGGPFEGEDESLYTTTRTVISKTNTLNTSLTKADSWIQKYTQEFTYQEQTNNSSSAQQYDDEQYSETPDETNHVDALGLAERFRREVQEDYNERYYDAITRVLSLRSRYYYKTVNRNININNTLETKKYISNPAEKEEKTDKNAKEDNFVTLFLKHKDARRNIVSAAEWLFEILEEGPNTVDYVDLTKYLMYKATGKDYGVTEFDFEEFLRGRFTKVTGMGSLQLALDYISGWENVATWHYLKDDGVYEYRDSPYIYKCITEDRKYFLCIADGLSTTTANRNFGFGVMHRSNSFKYNNVERYEKYGIDIDSGAYDALGCQLDVEIVQNVKRDIVSERIEKYKQMSQENGLDLKDNQIIALTAVSFQYGNIGKFVDVYKAYGNTEAFRRNFYVNGCLPFLTGYNGGTHRAQGNWDLFSKGIYRLSDGTLLEPTSYSAGDGQATEMQKKIAEIARNNQGTYPCTANYCAAWVTGVYQAAGAPNIPYGDAIDMWNRYQSTGSTSMDNIPIGAVVCGSGVGYMGSIYGHVGIYIGDGLVANNIGVHSIESLENWCSWQTATCQGHKGWIGWVYPGGVPTE